MKRFIGTILLFTHLFVSCTQNQINTTESRPSSTAPPTYDPDLANELGADDYGMSQYVLAVLLTGSSNSIDSAERVEIQRGHMANIKKMGEAGKLVLAGPFLEADSLRGIYIFNVRSIEEAEALTRSDPAIEAGVLRFEMYQWYASAALKRVRRISTQLKKPIN